MDRQVFAYSGVLTPRPGEPGILPLIEHALELGRTRWLWDGAVRLCYLPTAVGDDPRAIEVYEQVLGEREDVEFSVLRLFPGPSVPDVRKHLLRQDVVLVEDGSLVNLLAVWRAHGLDGILRRAWEHGVVLAGVSAGSICWYQGGTTDSFGPQLRPVTNALGFLPYGNGVHYDSEDQRRPLVQRLVADGTLGETHCTDDGVGLVYFGTALVEAVSEVRGKAAYRVTRGTGGGVGRGAGGAAPQVFEERLEPRFLG